MERLRARDPVAFEHLYDAYHRLVFGIALRMLSDTTMAEDLTQSVFLKIWSSPEAFRDGNFSAWLARVTRNRALDVLRSRASHTASEIPTDIPAEGNIDDIVFSKIAARSRPCPTNSARRSKWAFSAASRMKRSRAGPAFRSAP
jgi:RNA polymerase sigma factor (sigma-70 family)